MTGGRSCRLWAPLLALALLAVARPAWSHAIDSASLTLTEVAAGRFSVRFTSSSPTLEESLATAAVFPKGCALDGARLDCGPSGLVGPVAFPWLEGTLTRVMLDIEWQNGTRLMRVLTASSPSVTVYGMPASGGYRALAPLVVDYTRLGIEHILTGFDHLLFVVALSFLVRWGAPLVTTITAFTLAHSLTLAATVLGLVRVAVPPVEAAIALSIVLVCAECLRASDSLTRRAPWAVAFAFGLLHGLGFASALLDLGVPEQHVPTALLFFNVGVELGQLGVIAAVGVVGLLAARLRLERAWLHRSVVYAMGGVAAYWSLERIGAVFGL